MIGASIVIFVISRLSGDPTALLAPPDAPPSAMAATWAALGLDLPLWR